MAQQPKRPPASQPVRQPTPGPRRQVPQAPDFNRNPREPSPPTAPARRKQ